MKVDASNEASRFEPAPHEQQRDPEDETRKRYFDTDRIIERSSLIREHVNRSVEFERISEALGTRDTDFVWGIVALIMDAVADDSFGDAIGFVLSVIKDKRPRDHMERMAVTSAAVAFVKQMIFSAKASQPLTPDTWRSDFALKAATSYGRLYATLMSARKQSSSGGEQRVTVRHVSVSDGAQAIVGNVNDRRVIEDSPDASPMLTDARQAAMEPMSKQEPVRVRRERLDGR